MRLQLWHCGVSGPRLWGPGGQQLERLQGQGHFHFSNMHCVPVDERYTAGRKRETQGGLWLRRGRRRWLELGPSFMETKPCHLPLAGTGSRTQACLLMLPKGLPHCPLSPIPVYRDCSINALSSLLPAPMVGCSCPLPGVPCKHLLSINCILDI